MAKYVCSVCGYTVEGEAPEKCPVCGAVREVFVKMEDGNKIPKPSKIQDINFENFESKIDIEDWNYISKFKTYIAVDISEFAKKWGKELVKKTVNIPKWINTKAEELKINFSKTLEEALLKEIYEQK